MDMNSSRNSSFDAHEYYKRLTRCLALKNNLKVDARKIPGFKQINRRRQLPPLITKESINAKFLAKYGSRDELISPAGPSSSNQNDRKDEEVVSQSKISSKFKLKGTNVGQSKHKKEPEAYINLPPSFFKSLSVPDMSLFKIPDVPQVVKKKPPEPPASIAQTSDITMNSVTSAKFDPKKTSTPFDKRPTHQPMISDPDEIYRSLERPAQTKAVAMADDEKKKKFVNLIDRIAKKIDSKCFSNEPNPIEEIQRRILETYETSCRSPRLTNETLITDFNEEPPIRSLPLPKFYETKKPKPPVPSKLSQTAEIFNFTTKLKNANFNFNPLCTPEVVERRAPDGFSFLFTPTFPHLNAFDSPDAFELFDSPQAGSATDDDDDIFNFSPPADFPFDWGAPEAPNMHDTSAVFCSPPKSQRNKLQRLRQPSNDFTFQPDSSMRWPNRRHSSTIDEPMPEWNVFENPFETL